VLKVATSQHQVVYNLTSLYYVQIWKVLLFIDWQIRKDI